MASSFCLLLFFLFSLSFIASSSSSSDVLHGNEESGEGVGHELYKEYLRDEAVSRLNELGKVSDVDGYLERTFMSPASIKASSVISQWMEDAGLRTWVDHMGNGRADGLNSSAPALLIGSHLDTVVDAGKFDGALGIISAISALKVLRVNDKLKRLKRPIEVIAFSDEEGVRFQSTFLGSAAIAGILPPSSLNISDKRGITGQDVLKENLIEATEETLLQLKYKPESVWGYVEVTVSGSQGHAGTVPMSMRRNPMAASAELIVLLESLCKHPHNFLPSDVEFLSDSLVCTVGELSLWPSASNVIPGQVTFTVDLRTTDDAGREAILYELSKNMYNICDKCSVSCIIERKYKTFQHDANAVNCDSELSSQLKSAAHSAFKKMAGNVEVDVPKLMSGAGHDTMAMAHLTKMGMLFVRCRGGVSHSLDEHVLDDDVWVAGLAVLGFFENHHMEGLVG